MIFAILGNFSLMKTFCHHLSGINLGKENKTILNQKAGSCKTSELIHPFPFLPPILLQAPCREYINLTCLGIYIRLLSITRDFRFLYSPPVLYFCKRVLNKSNFTFFFSYSISVVWQQSAKYKSLDYSVPPLERQNATVLGYKSVIFVSTCMNYPSIIYVDTHSCLLNLYSYFFESKNSS